MNAPEVLTCSHRWWHAAGVTRHLVCSLCGMGQHGVDVRSIPHEVFLDGLKACTVHGTRCTATYRALRLVCELPAGHPADHVDNTAVVAWSPSIADRLPVDEPCVICGRPFPVDAPWTSEPFEHLCRDAGATEDGVR